MKTNFRQLNEGQADEIRKALARGRSYPISADDLRQAQSGVPEGEFYAPMFILGQRENHGFGYHCHILMRCRNRYKRAGYIVTFDNGTFYITQHGIRPMFDFEKHKKWLVNEIRLQTGNQSGIFSYAVDNCLKPPRDASVLFSL